jgi:hypothetical protein
MASAAEAGITPNSANTVEAADSTFSQQLYLFSLVQIRPIAGRVYRSINLTLLEKQLSAFSSQLDYCDASFAGGEKICGTHRRAGEMPRKRHRSLLHYRLYEEERLQARGILSRRQSSSFSKPWPGL